MAAVLYPPMPAHGIQERLGVCLAAADVIMRLMADLVADPPLAQHHDHHRQVAPQLAVADAVELLEDVNPAPLAAAVPAVAAFGAGVFVPPLVVGEVPVHGPDVLEQARLVRL